MPFNSSDSDANGPSALPPAADTAGLSQWLVNVVSDAVVFVDARGVIISGNNRAKLFFGTGPGGDLPSLPLCSLAIPVQQDDLRRFIDGPPSTAESAPPSFTFVKTDDSRFVAETVLSGAVDAGASPATLRAVLLRSGPAGGENDKNSQVMEQQLRSVYKMEALGQLARGIAHDLNNSLGAISGYVELLKRINETGDERSQRYISMIASAAQRSGAVINQLLTYARKNHMQIISFDVNEVIADIVKLLESSLDKNITIVQELNAKDAAIIGDPGQIQNSIVNLAINARDAMAAEGGNLVFRTENIVIDDAFARSRPYRMTHGYYLMIAVRDSGVGMDRVTLGHLFEPFFTTKEMGKGTGLGLASVYGSLKSHHGYIEVDSEVGRGSTFTMYLPVNQTSEKDVDTPADPAPAAENPQQTRKYHIMIVDDDRSLIEMLGELLSWLGYSVTPFLSPEEAISYYSGHSNEIDLAILDWKMPQIDGLECFRRMRAVNPRFKVLLSTGYCLDDERQSMLDEGVSGILPKPFVSAQLSSAIAEALSK